MAIYYILLIGSVLIGIPFCRASGLPEKKAKLLKAVYLIIVFSIFFVLSSIRKGTGYDYNLYAQWFNDIITINMNDLMSWNREKAFSLPVYILTRVTFDWEVMFAAIALIICASLAVYIYKHSSCAYISVAAFISSGLFYNSLNFMRQFIAGIIVAYALSYIHSKQFFRFIILVMFATCFHYSALLIIPFYFILQIRMNWILLGAYSAVAVLMIVFSYDILNLVTKFFYSAYTPSTSEHVYFGLSPHYTIMFAIVFLVVFLFRKDLIKKRPLNSVLINAFYFAVVFEFFGIKHSILSRFTLVFVLAPVVVLIPDLVLIAMQKVKNKFGKVFSVAVAALFCIYGFSTNAYLLHVNYNGVVPYHTIFDKTEASDGE